ncbi:hypothetical protein DdX_19758 [Ditylenchus destructor]|uniref:Uncharacterized protein n=1 Tax=Ditylenchus destructor TaxID=166010 RepID=A0AAD4MIF9_9BILA|nr:hypothetical protein DdX_19758 [Ditylenchus destructor]
MWYELLRYFSRKELVKLQSTNKFFDKAIRELKLPALHVINKLKIVMDDDEDGQDAAMCFIVDEDSSGNIVRHIQVEYFSPPNYVRFYEVVLIIFVPSADFLERLKQHKASFTDSVFLLHETDIETMKFFLREVFTECQHITMHLDEWTATSQQKIFSLTGLHNCNSVNLQSDQMMLHPEDPLKFMDDVEPHFYMLYATNVDASFLNEFADFSAQNAITDEEMFSHMFFDDDDGVIFCLIRAPVGTFT